MQKNTFTQEENREYLWKLFNMAKKVELAMSEHKAGFYGETRLNATDIRLISEVIYATQVGERLISTQVATRLGITRSAVSQIVAKLEQANILRRLPDDVDKKIAYLALTEETEEKLSAQVQEYSEYVGEIVAVFGAKRFETLLALVDEFSETVKEVESKKE